MEVLGFSDLPKLAVTYLMVHLKMMDRGFVQLPSKIFLPLTNTYLDSLPDRYIRYIQRI